MSKKNKAFTLIELLVVISIIALLLSILMPSLQKAKEAGMRAVCLSNLHQLAIAWTVYATANDDRIVNGNTWSEEQGTQPALIDHDGWVGWSFGISSIPSQQATNQHSAFLQTIEMQVEEIQAGALYPYIENIDAYKCPVGRRGNERTYSIVDSMNGWDPPSWGGPGVPNTRIYHNINKIKNGSQKLVFLDGGEQSYASWTLGDMSPSWMEAVQSRHGQGSTFSFADGHSEYRSWKHRYTKLVGGLSLYDYFYGNRPPEIAGSNWNCITSPDPINDPNPDFLWIQKGMWGRTYK